jgi:hypothetical protein
LTLGERKREKERERGREIERDRVREREREKEREMASRFSLCLVADACYNFLLLLSVPVEFVLQMGSKTDLMRILTISSSDLDRTRI